MSLKILIIRFSSIGDIVLTTPVIRCLKEQTNCQIHYVTKKQFSKVIQNNPYIDKLFLLEDGLNSLITSLKKEKYDYIIDLHHNLRSFIVKKRLGVPSFSFNKINIQKWLISDFKINILPDVHIVDRYLDTCSSFNIVNDNKGLDFFIDKGNEINISDLPGELHNGYFSLVIGAKHNTKQLPEDMLSNLCHKLRLPVILLGGKEDYEKGNKIISLMKQVSTNTNFVFNACGMYNIQQSASLVKQSEVVITHDTGLMHIAAALKKKIVSIWGNTIPEFGMYPYTSTEYKIFEVKLKCRPCSKIGYDKCPKGHFKCMRMQNIDEIVAACHQMANIK